MPKFNVTLRPKHFNNTFIEIHKKNSFLKKGELYDIFDRPPSDQFLPNFIGKFVLVDHEVIHRSKLTESHTRFDKDCSIEIYNKILDHKGHDCDQSYSIFTFSKSSKSC